MTADALIRTTSDLESACARARGDGILSLDTEFVWMRTYRPQLGIVQMGCREACWAVDCKSAIDTSALRALVEDGSVVKILHDAHQDLALIRHWTGAMPRHVFDTQLAAAFAGFPSGLGLQKLLLEAVGVGLPKTETCTDWLQRPLSEAQVKYALDDVRYLPRLRDALIARSESLGTLVWMEEEQRRHENAAGMGDEDPLELWKRIKLRRVRLDGRGRAVLRSVAALRDGMARKWNLPRGWLGDDGSLVRMAETGRVERVVHKLRGGQGDTIRALYASAVAEALECPESDWPDDPVRHYIPEVKAAADAALEWLETKAEELHVAPGAVASRAVVTAFLDDVSDESNPLACGWRHEAVGREMAERFGVE